MDKEKEEKEDEVALSVTSVEAIERQFQEVL